MKWIVLASSVLLFHFSAIRLNAQITTASQWTWIKGDNTLNQPGVYGTQGVAEAANKPGARGGNCASWTDASGNCWLFGGYQSSGNSFSDLWKYNPSATEWTWVKGPNIVSQPGVYGTQGTAAPANQPGARYLSATWTDDAGNFWLLGGVGYATSNLGGSLNDLWKYNPATNQWTWVNGANSVGQPGTYGTLGVPAAANRPGARQNSISWKDAAGNFWLFGGLNFDGVNLNNFNDLWKYNPVTNQWTWVNGSNVPNQPGSYGTLGVSAATNRPGARSESAFWTDNAGDFWLLGGSDYNFNLLNDLWKYNPATNQWTWVNGTSIANQPGSYGTLGVTAAGNKPGARGGSRMATDASGNFWLFGGGGYANSSINYSYLNDLWRYEPATNIWTWIKGANTINQPGIYGIKGTADATNRPGARAASALWMDASGNLLLFGGANETGIFNDLWKLGNTNVSLVSVNNGDWNTSSTWAGGIVPSSNDIVIVRHAVTVQLNTSCYSLKIEGSSGNVTVKTGVQFIVLH